ncbi:hypothetical protein AWW66_01700 [Micromonospora rosaria]|uniref:DUF5671 domain-containing protein n=1 Tax=Micromonospora rosaria TaxID=47874 RepID=A0A136PZ05_9ACTN|nr:hypothetical protein [Micromonospora rosaria]KXK63701.1 hypothetical protein AWW66_01700 [Micromonospora rosaria]
MSTHPDPRARLAGGLLFWYAVLGGAIAWALHLLTGWGIDELACAAGSEAVGPVPLRTALSATVVLPALATVGALLAATLLWRRTTHVVTDGEDRPVGRSRLLALVGIWSNLLFLTIIVLGGIALLVLPPCQR